MLKINKGDKFLLIKKDGTVYSREITITVDEFDNILLYRGDVISYNTINGKEYVF